MEAATNMSYANSTCQDNSMQLMTVDSNMTQTALTIFVQETLSEGIFWVDGGNGSDTCNVIAIDGSGSVVNQTNCIRNSFYSICEYKDSKVPKNVDFPMNLDACGFVFPIMTDATDRYTRYGCVMAYTRSYVDSNYNCILNGMQMFKISPLKVLDSLNMFLITLFGKNSGVIMWVNGAASNGSCSYLDGSKDPFAVGQAGCDQLNWSVCEAPYDGSY
jgi:hypothetical protein